eukprot:CAMPEP_0114337202 /NCGR_PEP_ID=MMETSP0101-20121206/6210_1 /TAXON_ID=38822 ORGANISM="Pteridomonas danica, Strain PT" /NCGR_SAMPLE_ID=MMETSP0101 /ASSEMBLY_ACC=CAM_ASM_000211 /LENGTH=232 /DNA_ID=CAMNT_0001469367 /DNA_START=80 /DNA_END=778 /DNA_ORIENTATION=+
MASLEKKDQLDDVMSLVMAQSGQEEEEVTDEQAAAVIAEILGGGGETSAEDLAPRKTLLPYTTKCLDQAKRAIRLAVGYDTNNQKTEALDSYEQAIGLFSESLEDEALSDKNAVRIVQSMESYLDRSIELQLSQTEDQDYTSASNVTSARQRTLTNMVKHNFNTLKRGVSLYSRAKKTGGGDDWITFILFTESLECLITALKSSNASAKSPMVSKCIDEMITKLEDIKAKNK